MCLWVNLYSVLKRDPKIIDRNLKMHYQILMPQFDWFCVMLLEVCLFVCIVETKTIILFKYLFIYSFLSSELCIVGGATK